MICLLISAVFSRLCDADGAIPETDELAGLWKQVVSMPVQTIDSFSTINGVAWLDEVKRLYVRPCYLTLKQLIIGKLKSVLLLGTPGIGKSMFLRWLMVILARERLQSTDTTKPHVSFRVCFSKKDYYCCTSSVKVRVYTADLDTPHYYFSDSIDISEYGLSSELTLLVSSDDATHYKEWRKKVLGHTRELNEKTVACGAILYMAIFDQEEMNKVAPTDMNLNIRQFRFDVVNGLARQFLSPNSGHANDATMKLVGAELDEFFAGCPIKKSNDWNDARTWAVNTIGLALMCCTDEKNTQIVFNSVFKYLVVDTATGTSTGKTWTSTLLKHIAGKIMED